MQPVSGESQPINYETIVRKVSDLPSLPDVVDKIVEKLGLPNTSAQEIASIIAYDPGLTSKFIRIVNSAAYGFQRQISSVQHAIMIIGFTQVRGVVLSAGIFKMFGKKAGHGLDHNAFWQHCTRTAIASRVMANKWNIPYAEDAFSAGLLHDIGKMTLDTYFGPQYAKTIHEAKRMGLLAHGEDFASLEQELLSIDHAELGYMLAQRWRMPTTLSQVIRYHHKPEQAEEAQQLVYVVALANAFSKLIQYHAGVFHPTLIPANILSYFNFDEANPEPFEALFKQIKSEMTDVDELIAGLRS